MTVLAWVLQGILALLFLMAGFGKITGSKMHIEGFKKWGYPQWFRIVTGVIELGAAILLIIGFWDKQFALIGAIIYFVVGIGGVITHIRVKDSFKETSMILVIALLGLILALILL